MHVSPNGAKNDALGNLALRASCSREEPFLFGGHVKSQIVVWELESLSLL